MKKNKFKSLMDTVVEPTFKNQLAVFNWYFLHVVISKAKWYII
ncbi:hypothetical protein C1A50_0466 [Paenibacillus polymyxa]|nr:hypothetical protein C1A50_0466 [Paenibacillus polymyxa]